MDINDISFGASRGSGLGLPAPRSAGAGPMSSGAGAGAPSSHGAPRCAGCGAWGGGVVKSNGYCDHCGRTGAASASASAGHKRRRAEGDEELDHGGGGHGRGEGDDDEDAGAGAGAGAGRARSAGGRGGASGGSGAGVTPAEISRLLEEADKADLPTLDVNGVKRMLLKVEKAITKNQIARAKHGNEPAKFLDSEAELDAELKSLRSLAAAPEHYPVLSRSETLPSLLALLAHENPDIATDVVMLLVDLTAEDAVGEDVAGMIDADEDDEDAAAASSSTSSRLTREAGKALVDAVIAQSGAELLLAHAERLDASGTPEDAESLLNALVLFVQCVELQPSSSSALCRVLTAPAPATRGAGAKAQQASRLLSLLLRKVRAKEYDDVKGSASELLALLLATDDDNARLLGTGSFQLTGKDGSAYTVDGVEYLLEAINVYKKRTPEGREEKECVENLFDAMATCLVSFSWVWEKGMGRWCCGEECLLLIIHSAASLTFPSPILSPLPRAASPRMPRPVPSRRRV
jgi:hypothetical protein